MTARNVEATVALVADRPSPAARPLDAPPASSGTEDTLDTMSADPATEPATSSESDPCPWCGARESLFWVRSHVQCRACGQVVESCCEGPAGCA